MNSTSFFAENIELYSSDQKFLLTALLGSEKKAVSLLATFPTLEEIDSATIQELSSVVGIGKQLAIRIKSSIKLGRLLLSVPLDRGSKITGSLDVFNAYRYRFKGVLTEEFHLLLLDSKNRIMKDCQVGAGTTNSVQLDPKTIFSTILKNQCTSVILLHNHPSGDPEPSCEDRMLTKRIKEGCDLLGITVLDHIIIGDTSHFGFTDNGLM